MSVPEHVIDDELNKPSYLQQRSVYDWVWAVVLMAGTFYARVIKKRITAEEEQNDEKEQALFKHTPSATYEEPAEKD